MKMNSYLGAFAAVSSLLVAGAVSAAPIQGDVTFFGAWQAKAADGTTTVAIENAAHISFGNTIVSQAIGDFSGAAGASVTYTNFTFDPFTAPLAPLWSFVVGSTTFSFALEDITRGMQTSKQLTLIGTGTAKAAGFDDTPFIWTFSGDATSGGLLSFSASAFNVPEPSVIGLLGLGLIAMGAVGVRRRSAARKA